ncbi:fumarylacetoacetate hydrolase family protein [Gonapodya prolifera JEL478]|uniref:Fumarylacetoacetate hydrolase family protein n=1 Tax=Gonapodya prolifera (strain JEL478) TaxID=1344416 RepID=A0A139AXM5_GONPJ|nr:fumarylacetoacetate hydrolase family protein [Gonapodya prolifera JEL478]|eukprot:KXS21469.1 fumarylacetoacetate hydrolase family protein [Gonapodya prolifera JEL478]
MRILQATRPFAVAAFAPRFVRSFTAARKDWTRLIRFVSDDGQIYYGEPASLTDRGELGPIDKVEARVVEGFEIDSNGVAKGSITTEVRSVSKLLSPIDPASVPHITCIGINYRKHAAETNMPVPVYPIVFSKSRNAVNDPLADVVVPETCTNRQIDYEVELAVVIGKPTKNVPPERALDHVLGYTTSNDVSARKWQGAKLGGGQWNFSKSFDGFAPLGPMLVTPEIIPNPNSLQLTTEVNGEEVQNSSTADMIFDVKNLISFLSQGTTLLPGTVILTGTPQGVGFTRSPPLYVENGDRVKCWVEKIGATHNKFVYEGKGEGWNWGEKAGVAGSKRN